MAYGTQESQASSVGDYYESDDEEEDSYKYFEEELMEESETLEQRDPEWYEYSCILSKEVWPLLQEEVCQLTQLLHINEPIARLLLQSTKWEQSTALEKFQEDRIKFYIEAHVYPSKPQGSFGMCIECPICFATTESMCGLECGHMFCSICWVNHITSKLERGIAMSTECMQCDVLMTLELVERLLENFPADKERYHQIALSQLVESHPLLRWCPGKDCDMVFVVKESLPKRIQCSQCSSVTCFKCGEEYHCPTECEIFKNWLVKCLDDSETANYISSNTKDCPKCHTAIEKNGGCNHIHCVKCQHDFCWMCLGHWSEHSSEYYACSRYNANPDIAKGMVTSAREALKKYLFYFERWDNHHRSLLLEEQTHLVIQTHIQDQVDAGVGTWIDWQYLLDAAGLLRKCRYTLKYTYPHAYWMEGDKKQLFEYQQAQLELQIENLSWKVERATITDRADLERQMNVTEIRRITLLRDFTPKLINY